MAGRAGLLALLLTACATEHPTAPDIPSGDPARFQWRLPPGFPAPAVPADNPMSDAKVELGRRLFYDNRLSGNQSASCASCHWPDRAFAEPRNLAVGSTGQAHPRSTIPLSNVAYQIVLGWADPNLRRLEAQARVPMFNQAPVELGLTGREGEVLQRLSDVSLYRALFAAAFPHESRAITIDNVTRAIASFERTFFSGNAPYDRFVNGDVNAISESAKRGDALFHSDRLKCAQCHRGPLFTNATTLGSPAVPESSFPEFFNTGLYNIGGTGAYPANNTGLLAITGVPSDMGKFKVPSLRNVDVTPPYMHDGTVPTLDAVIDHYAAGGRTLTVGPNAGDGSLSRYKSSLIAGFTISMGEREEVKAFLRTLTDSTFLFDPRLQNPWIRVPPR